MEAYARSVRLASDGARGWRRENADERLAQIPPLRSTASVSRETQRQRARAVITPRPVPIAGIYAGQRGVNTDGDANLCRKSRRFGCRIDCQKYGLSSRYPVL